MRHLITFVFLNLFWQVSVTGQPKLPTLPGSVYKLRHDTSKKGGIILSPVMKKQTTTTNLKPVAINTIMAKERASSQPPGVHNLFELNYYIDHGIDDALEKEFGFAGPIGLMFLKAGCKMYRAWGYTHYKMKTQVIYNGQRSMVTRDSLYRPAGAK